MLALAVAAVVLIVTPMVFDAPNPLAPPAALVVAVGCGCAWVGGQTGRWVSSAVSWSGLLLSVLWLIAASYGFGKGTPWWDDILEASILTGAFLVAAMLSKPAGER